MLLPDFWINRKLFLGAVFLSDADVGLPQAVADIGQVRIELAGFLIFRYGVGILVLVGVEIAQLQVYLRRLWIQRQRCFQQRFDLMEVKAGIFRSLSLPQTHGVVVVGARVSRLKFRKTAESLDHFLRLAGRTVVGLGQKEITVGIGRVEISPLQ